MVARGRVSWKEASYEVGTECGKTRVIKDLVGTDNFQELCVAHQECYLQGGVERRMGGRGHILMGHVHNNQRLGP